jgi:hypothetical protein
LRAAAAGGELMLGDSVLKTYWQLLLLVKVLIEALARQKKISLVLFMGALEAVDVSAFVLCTGNEHGE